MSLRLRGAERKKPGGATETRERKGNTEAQESVQSPSDSENTGFP